MGDQQGDDVPDMSGLQSRYTWSTGRGLRVFLFMTLSVQAVVAVIRLVGDPDTFEVVLSTIQLVTFAFFLGAYFVWTPSTRLTAEGVRLQNGFPRGRLIAWDRVREVQVRGRWQDASLLVLSNGRDERLIGMPVEDAQRLAEALAARTAR